MRRTALFALLFPLALLFLPCCDDDDNPVGGGDPDPSPRGAASPESLVVLLADAYNTEDSTDYADLLDSLYVFALDPDNINPGWWTDSTWGKKTECAIAGNMFAGSTNKNGQRTNSICLTFYNITKQVDETPYAGKPAGETWWRVTAWIDLRVEVENPHSPDGVTLFLVASDQEFVARPAPEDRTRWILFRQEDQESYGKAGSGTAREETSWGAVKSLFHPANMPPPADSLSALIERFAEAYSARDSAAYAAFLDPEYVFELAPSGLFPDGPVEWWDLGNELRIAGRMFSGWENEDVRSVESIDLAISAITSRVETGSFEGYDPFSDEPWYRIVCSIDLLVAVDDPTSMDGETLFHVTSGQEFTVRPDPGDPEEWVVFRQYDQEPYNKTRSTEEASWGAVKQLWR
ncbi:MAG: hypothetical protein JW958_10355 [Candidatus Eisenbacteria bacterium]|nr:hypothetical protein [Candidatus Eisenbacteria bacterium]